MEDRYMLNPPARHRNSGAGRSRVRLGGRPCILCRRVHLDAEGRTLGERKDREGHQEAGDGHRRGVSPRVSAHGASSDAPCAIEALANPELQRAGLRPAEFQYR